MNWDALGAIAELLGAIAVFFDFGLSGSSGKSELEGNRAAEQSRKSKNSPR